MPSWSAGLRSSAAMMAISGTVALVASSTGSVADVAAHPTDEHAPLAGADEPCVLRGFPVIAAHEPIWSARKGGRVIAGFSGNRTALAVHGIDPDGRSSVSTGTGEGSFRLSGYADTSHLTFYAEGRIPVVAGHLWINDRRRVRLVAYDEKKLTVKISARVRAPVDQRFEAWTTCEHLALHLHPRSKPAVPYVPSGDAVGWLAKGEVIRVYDTAGPRPKRVVELRSAGHGILFWATDERNGFLRVRHVSDVVVEGWVARSELLRLPRGEITDHPGLLGSKRAAPRFLRPRGKYREVVTRGEVPIRTRPSEDAPVIGRIEKNTRTLVERSVAGWTSVLPASMHIVPPRRSRFWGRTETLVTRGSSAE